MTARQQKPSDQRNVTCFDSRGTEESISVPFSKAVCLFFRLLTLARYGDPFFIKSARAISPTPPIQKVLFSPFPEHHLLSHLSVNLPWMKIAFPIPHCNLTLPKLTHHAFSIIAPGASRITAGPCLLQIHRGYLNLIQQHNHSGIPV